MINQSVWSINRFMYPSSKFWHNSHAHDGAQLGGRLFGAAAAVFASPAVSILPVGWPFHGGLGILIGGRQNGVVQGQGAQHLANVLPLGIVLVLIKWLIIKNIQKIVFNV
jgi:hypothetical protein